MVAKHRAAIHVDDHQQPDPLDLELLLEPERIAHDDLEPHVEAVAVEFDDVQRLHGRRCRSGVAWHSLEVGRSGETSAAREAVQTLCAQCARKRPNAHPLRIEWVVGRGEPELAALKQEIGVHVLEASQSRVRRPRSVLIWSSAMRLSRTRSTIHAARIGWACSSRPKAPAAPLPVPSRLSWTLAVRT